MGSASSTNRRHTHGANSSTTNSYPATRNRRSSTGQRRTSQGLPLHQMTGSVVSASSGGSNVPHGRIVPNSGSSTPAATTTISRPGAYSISRLASVSSFVNTTKICKSYTESFSRLSLLDYRIETVLVQHRYLEYRSLMKSDLDKSFK